MDTGATDFAAAVRAGRYPSDSDLAALDEQASAAAQHAATLGAAATRAAHHHRHRLADALKGAAGDAQVAEVSAQASRWCAHADDHELARTAVENAAGELRGLQYDLDLLIESAEPQYNAALRLGKTTAAQGILTATLAEADGMVTERSAAATGHITAVGFSTTPPHGAPAQTQLSASRGNPTMGSRPTRKRALRLTLALRRSRAAFRRIYQVSPVRARLLRTGPHAACRVTSAPTHRLRCRRDGHRVAHPPGRLVVGRRHLRHRACRVRWARRCLVVAWGRQRRRLRRFRVRWGRRYRAAAWDRLLQRRRHCRPRRCRTCPRRSRRSRHWPARAAAFSLGWRRVWALRGRCSRWLRCSRLSRRCSRCPHP